MLMRWISMVEKRHIKSMNPFFLSHCWPARITSHQQLICRQKRHELIVCCTIAHIVRNCVCVCMIVFVCYFFWAFCSFYNTLHWYIRPHAIAENIFFVLKSWLIFYRSLIFTACYSCFSEKEEAKEKCIAKLFSWDIANGPSFYITRGMT